MLNLYQDPYSEFSYPLEQETRHGFAKLENTTIDGEKWYSFFDDEDIKQYAEDNDMTVEEMVKEEKMEEATCVYPKE